MSLSSNFPTIKPSLNLDFANTKRLDPRVTFTRSTTGTYYDGVTTAMAEQNLLLYSQELDNAAYTKSTVTVTANSSTAPDGTSTADLVFPSSTGVDRAIGISTIATQVGLPYTISVYAKASGLNFIYFLTYGGSTSPTTQLAFFNLSTGAVGQTGSYFTSASIVSVGNGWYRCIATANATIAGSYPYIGLADANNSGTATASGSNGVLLWGFQFEQRSTVTAYTATTTQPITNYIPVLLTAAANVPRFDHNPTTDESLGLLIEEQRTNLATYSGDFSNAAWSKSDATVTGNTIVAPDGTISGSAMTSATASAYVFRTFSASAIAYTQSFYAKAGSISEIRLDFVTSGFGSGASCTFNLSTGTAGAIVHWGGSSGFTAAIQSVGNGWYRCSITGTATAATWFFELAIINNIGKFVYIWGAQLEAGGFATSYIATTAASATRNADAASMTGTNFSSWFNNGEGSLFASSDLKGSANLGMIAELGDGGYDNRIIIFGDQYALSSYDVKVGGAGPVSIIAGGITFNVPFRLAAAYKANDFAVSQNGATVQTDTSGTVPTVTALYLGYQGGGGGVLNGHIQRFTYYPARLTNAQLQALTS